ncbi:MAG TPA: M20/M25/M40 family metallo-hydrolase [Gemmatimonadaceae bacterium]|nr:M20/M25/M40 family metallo-hydrolase [Gemmatimonadaceae bacterium]
MSQSTGVSESDVRRLLGALAHDSMEGRGTGTRGSARAARFIADELARYGVQAAGDSGFFQRVPVALRARNGRTGLALLPSLEARDTVAQASRAIAVNVVGIIPGTDPALRDQVVLIDAHYDHLGMQGGQGADSIFNGADDDASGVVAVMEIARALAAGPAPKRTVVVAATTGEEVGLLGTRWYIQHPVRPLEAMVANLEIEMIGRPDSLAGGVGKGWLTGFERSTMGDLFKAAGLPIVADARPNEQFFMRSDNIAFAQRGIVAHTLSSYNMHTDYHQASDDVSHVDFAHMTQLVDVAVRAARLVADSPTKLEWKPGGRPAAQ